MIDKEKINQIKNAIEQYVAVKQGVKEDDLRFALLIEVAPENRALIERAISEAVSEKLVVRIEYQIPHDHTFHAFYLPIGTKIY